MEEIFKSPQLEQPPENKMPNEQWRENAETNEANLSEEKAANGSEKNEESDRSTTMDYSPSSRPPRPLPLELNCQVFECLKLPIQLKFICGLGRGIYAMSRRKVLKKKKEVWIFLYNNENFTLWWKNDKNIQRTDVMLRPQWGKETDDECIKQKFLAEAHRRLMSLSEYQNTSYLNGILRRGINKHGGRHLRQILAGYRWGLEMQTGKRKSIQVTTFSALCESESINMVEDPEKIIKINGFPHVKVAEEIERRELCQHNAISPERLEKRLLDIRSTIFSNQFGNREILREVIRIVQMGIEKETQQFVTLAEKMPAEAKDNELMPQTLDPFKRFSRLSHCFGNRAVLVSWQALLEVLGQLKGIQTGGYLQLQSV